MKRFIVSAICAAVLAVPVFAGGDCCANKGKETAAKPAACAKEGASAQKSGSCPKTGAGAQAQSGEKASCCSGEQAKAPAKACQTCDSHSWMMSKPNADCKACQTASL